MEYTYGNKLQEAALRNKLGKKKEKDWNFHSLRLKGGTRPWRGLHWYVLVAVKLVLGVLERLPTGINITTEANCHCPGEGAWVQEWKFQPCKHASSSLSYFSSTLEHFCGRQTGIQLDVTECGCIVSGRHYRADSRRVHLTPRNHILINSISSFQTHFAFWESVSKDDSILVFSYGACIHQLTTVPTTLHYHICVLFLQITILSTTDSSKDAVVHASNNIFLRNKAEKHKHSCFVKVKVAQPCPILVTPWTVAHQAPLYVEFSMQ